MECLNKNSFKRVFCVLLSTIFAMTIVLNAENPKREMRSAWIGTVWQLDWPRSSSNTAITGTGSSIASQQRAALQTMINNLANQGFNAVFFQVRSMCDAMYNSAYEPWSQFLVGTRGATPSWDPLAECVEMCHARGMECHAWINPYRFSTGTNYTTANDNTMRNAGWLITYNGTTVMNPGNASARWRIASVCNDIVSKYKVDGIIFDDYFYPNGIPTNSTAPDYSNYTSSGTSMSFADWRRSNTVALLTSVNNLIHQTKADVRFGVSPAGQTGISAASHGLDAYEGGANADWQYNGIFSDPVDWMEKGVVDYLSPQVYWPTYHATAQFDKIAPWWYYAADKFKRNMTISCSITGSGLATTTAGYEEIAKEITVSRNGAKNDTGCGIAFYSAAYINGPKASGLGNYLRSTVFSTKSLPTVLKWKSPINVGDPSGLSLSGSTLYWNSASSGNSSNLRYSVYCIPRSVKPSQAMGADGDGIDGKYLVGMFYGTSASVSTGDYWYVVCTLDGNGYEHNIVSLNAPEDAPEPEVVITMTPECNFKGSMTVIVEAENAKSSYYKVNNGEQKSFTNSATFKISETSTVFVSATNSRGTVTKSATYTRIEDPTPGPEPSPLPIDSLGTWESGYKNNFHREEGSVYSPNEVGTYMYNLWIRSNGYGNFSTLNGGALNRGMAAVGSYVYIVSRSANSSTATTKLYKIKGQTGEIVKTFTISGVQTSYFPSNNLCHDNNGNLCMSNLTLNLSTTPLVVHNINTETGAARKICSVTYTGGGRVDHCTVRGNVATGNFIVFAPVASGTKIVKWTFTNGSLTSTQAFTPNSYYPSNASNFSTAPNIFAIGDDNVLVDGYSTNMSRYTLSGSTATLGTTLSNISSNLVPTDPRDNGCTFFTNSDAGYFAYVYNPSCVGSGVQWLVARTTTSAAMAGMQRQWLIPSSPMGTVNATIFQAQVDYAATDDREGIIYVYSPGNGLAAYLITSKSYGNQTSAEFTVADNAFDFQILCDEVLASSEADMIEVYSISGGKVASVRNATTLSLSNLTSGAYIVRATKKGKVVTRKMILQ